eukprot:jgi/Botrbrau1/13040/Bobra.0187s0003.1
MYPIEDPESPPPRAEARGPQASGRRGALPHTLSHVPSWSLVELASPTGEQSHNPAAHRAVQDLPPEWLPKRGRAGSLPDSTLKQSREESPLAELRHEVSGQSTTDGAHDEVLEERNERCAMHCSNNVDWRGSPNGSQQNEAGVPGTSGFVGPLRVPEKIRHEGSNPLAVPAKRSRPSRDPLSLHPDLSPSSINGQSSTVGRCGVTATHQPLSPDLGHEAFPGEPGEVPLPSPHNISHLRKAAPEDEQDQNILLGNPSGQGMESTQPQGVTQQRDGPPIQEATFSSLPLRQQYPDPSESASFPLQIGSDFGKMRSPKTTLPTSAGSPLPLLPGNPPKESHGKEDLSSRPGCLADDSVVEGEIAADSVADGPQDLNSRQADTAEATCGHEKDLCLQFDRGLIRHKSDTPEPDILVTATYSNLGEYQPEDVVGEHIDSPTPLPWEDAGVLSPSAEDVGITLHSSSF